MERVGLFLQTQAHSYPSDSGDFDIFGRSSFNRYYYAAYLQVRSFLGSLNATWALASHKSIPDILKGQILTKIVGHRKRAGKIGDKEAVIICNRAASSIRELAALMTQAYAVRVAADYYPDIAVVRDDKKRFHLNEVAITTAHDWGHRARGYGQDILRAWDLLDD